MAKRDASVECFASSNGQSKLVTRSSANREVSVCKKKRDSVKYLRRWISVAAATAALPTPRILTKYSRSFIRFRRNISVSLSRARTLARFSPMVRTLFATSIDERNVSRQRRKQQVVEINDSDPSEKPFSCCYSFILPGFARPCYRHVIIIYTRCRSNFLTISLPLSSKFRTRTTIFAPYS